MAAADPFWPSGKRAALSLTFDDARWSQMANGFPLLEACGVKATDVSLHHQREATAKKGKS